MELDEGSFERRALATLDLWGAYLEDEGPDSIECELEEGILTLIVAGAGTFLLSRHAPSRQLWLSSPLSGASHYAFTGGEDGADGEDGAGRWLSTRGGADLARTLSEELTQACGSAVTLPLPDFSAR